jgi:hypothetical protein
MVNPITSACPGCIRGTDCRAMGVLRIVGAKEEIGKDRILIALKSAFT